MPSLGGWFPGSLRFCLQPLFLLVQQAIEFHEDSEELVRVLLLNRPLAQLSPAFFGLSFHRRSLSINSKPNCSQTVVAPCSKRGKSDHDVANNRYDSEPVLDVHPQGDKMTTTLKYRL